MRNGFFVYTHGQIINKRVNGMITSATQMEWNDLPKEKKKKEKKIIIVQDLHNMLKQ